MLSCNKHFIRPDTQLQMYGLVDGCYKVVKVVEVVDMVEVIKTMKVHVLGMSNGF